MHMKAVYRRTPTIGIEDVATTSHDFWRDPDPDVAYATTVGTAFSTFWQAIKTEIPSQVVLQELRFYLGYDGDGSPGELDHLISVNDPGINASGMLPPQCACSVTEIVGPGQTGRKHWGRFYLPGGAKDATTAEGRWDTAFVNLIATAAETFYDGLRDGTNGPIVWSRVTTGGPQYALVDSVRVDDIVDIIRRRRWDAVQLRVTKPIE
jgi:hypothetical protein